MLHRQKMSTHSTASGSSGAKKKTPCSFFAAGKCRNGSSCKFFHAQREDLAVSPLPCKFFLRGTCTAGRECKFSHSAEAQAAATRVSSSTGEKTVAPGSYKIPCKFFKYGDCSNGDKCPYLHVVKKEESEGNDKAEAQTEGTSTPDQHTEEEKVTSPDPETSGEEDKDNEDVTELKDFISKEEELYYYGAPGEFEDAVADSVPPMPKESYMEVTKKTAKNRPLSFDEERPAPPYGDTCFYAHALPERVESEEEMLAMGEEIRLSQELECGICYENIIKKGERFGLLSGCNHSFCLTCLRNWRSSEDQPKQTVRQCPVCRVETKFIIPSSRMVTKPERKRILIDVYRQNLSGIPCRHFDEGRGTCPFGSSCFYAHRYPDGTLASRQVRTAVDADGQYDVLRQVRLEHFLKQSDGSE
ncbi:E3 ubiquitin-protein ligase makorin-1 [Phytophthora citrophthora]|uniref:E3 ubiquitin-protein ligase makorin-1 n=1 Tax=Phytophthora citrophthora TaxID=4793 RepID=A0AAD9GU20_9STRA|nr:E3 ubiquitin-protein ligase makorin-1 [Phytophthora citrophthora]